MFHKASLWNRIRSSFYDPEPLARELKGVFGDRTDLSPENLKCLLLAVTRNVTTDSPWPLTSNPLAKYNNRAHPDCNLKIPLWKLVRASTAAPVYFPPEKVTLKPTNRIVLIEQISRHRCGFGFEAQWVPQAEIMSDAVCDRSLADPRLSRN